MNGSQYLPFRGSAGGYKIPKRVGAKHFASAAFKTDGDLSEEIKGLSGDIQKLAPIVSEAKTLANEAKGKTAEMLKQLEELNADSTKSAEWRKEAEERAKANQTALDGLLVEMKTMREGGIFLKGQGNDFGSAFAKTVEANYEKIKGVSSGMGSGKMYLDKGAGLHMKAASNMTTAGNLTGDSVITYVPTPVLTPRQLVNVRDLVPGFQSATGTIAIFRENFNGGVSPEAGAFGQQTTEGALKEQVGYLFTHVNFTANYIGGFVRISKQMLQDLPFLQTYLPGMLLRDYYKYENSQFYTAIVNAALGTPGSAGANDAETLMNGIANLEGYNFAPNGIVTTPAEWMSLLKTTYTTTPIGVMYNYASQQLEIAGVPILKATWVGADKAIIADWTQAQVATVDGLRVEFFEQDSDNVQRNLITVRVEARVVLVTGQPYAFTIQSL